jgi:hypothetical protein
MSDCNTCSELSNSADDALSSINAILKKIDKAIADRDPERVAALDLELDSAIAHKDAAVSAWLHHRKSHAAVTVTS